MNAARRKNLGGANLPAIAEVFEAFADRADLLAQDWANRGTLERLRAVVADADNEVGVLEAANADLSCEADAEQEAFDNLPEGLQQAERGQAMEDAAGHLQTAMGDLDEASSSVTDAAKALQRLEGLIGPLPVDSLDRLIFDDGGLAEEVEGLYVEICGELRVAADAVRGAADAVEEAICC